jgi:hypothetical protein
MLFRTSGRDEMNNLRPVASVPAEALTQQHLCHSFGWCAGLPKPCRLKASHGLCAKGFHEQHTCVHQLHLGTG